MRLTSFAIPVLLLALTLPAMGLERTEFKMRDDFGTEPLYDCMLNYYYYTPCPTFSWFWAFHGWDYGDIVGAWFQVGDLSMFTGQACDPTECHTLEQIRVLDFAGYGSMHGCACCVEIDVFCSDEYGCPIGPSLWNSGVFGLDYAWNYVAVDPPISICGCSVNPGNPPSAPRVLVTATCRSPYGYPQWGLDDISQHVDTGCEMHEYSCLQALYPRPYNSHYALMHSGFYGQDFEYCPPLWWADGQDTTPDATRYGYIELAWRIYLVCSGPTNVKPATWGNIKSMYR